MQRNDKKKIIQEQIILVMDLQPSIHRDFFLISQLWNNR